MKRFFSPDNLILFVVVLLLLVLRTWFGIHVNWVEEDYIQIYLIGLEDAFVLDWSYWGPDVFWSKTRIPGAMQGVLAGKSIALFRSMYAPIVVSNIISAIGMLLFASYVHRRFPQIPLLFLVPYLLLLLKN